MSPTPFQTALLLAVMLHRAGKTRARVSEKTIQFLSEREVLYAFIPRLRVELEEYGILMYPLNRGGFGLVAVSALEGAPSLLAKNHVSDEIEALRNRNLNEQALHDELTVSAKDQED